MRRICLLIAALILTLTIPGCSKESPSASAGEPCLTLDGSPLENNEAFLAIRLEVEGLEGYGDYQIDWDGEIDGTPSRRYVLEQALEIISLCRSLQARADELGYSLTQDEQAEIDEIMAQDAEYMGGSAEYKEFVSERYGPMELYRLYQQELPMLYDKLFEELFGESGAHYPSEDDIKAYYAENYINCAYILISATDEGGYPMEGEELERQRLIASALLGQALGGADFFALVAEHGQDYYMSVYPEGYPVFKGLHGELFDSALSGLKAGEISDVVYSGDAFYIIRRLPDDDGYLTDNYEEVLYDYMASGFEALVSQWTRELDLQASPAYWELDPLQYLPGVG